MADEAAFRDSPRAGARAEDSTLPRLDDGAQVGLAGLWRSKPLVDVTARVRDVVRALRPDQALCRSWMAPRQPFRGQVCSMFAREFGHNPASPAWARHSAATA